MKYHELLQSMKVSDLFGDDDPGQPEVASTGSARGVANFHAGEDNYFTNFLAFLGAEKYKAPFGSLTNKKGHPSDAKVIQEMCGGISVAASILYTRCLVSSVQRRSEQALVYVVLTAYLRAHGGLRLLGPRAGVSQP